MRLLADEARAGAAEAILSVLRVPAPGAADPIEDGLLLPVPSSGAASSILVEERDGRKLCHVVAAAVRLDVDDRRTREVRDAPIGVFVTDARVAIACSPYTHGGGWYGDGAATALLNAASDTLTALRRRRKMLVGQIRYPWLAAVGSTARAGWGTEERLILEAGDQRGCVLRLVVQLPRSASAQELAAAVARRAAAYRLASVPAPNDAVSEALRLLADAEPLAPAPTGNAVVRHVFPAPAPVCIESARIAPAAAASQRPAARSAMLSR